MKLDPDLTKIAQHAGLYVLLLIILKLLYIDPVMSLLRKRESLTSGRAEKSKSLKDKLLQMKTDHSERIGSIRQELESQRLDKIKALRKAAEDRIRQVKMEGETKLASQKKDLEKELSQLKDRMPELSQTVSRQIVDVILDGKVARS